uniref:Uncharacterized protein n=1 Tax=viral metagenome TaxID=1070528 RepID=A0A6H1ZS10_9ZZZZ
MKASDAFKIVDKIDKICKDHGLWISVKTEKKPDLKIIRIEEISIKVDEK